MTPLAEQSAPQAPAGTDLAGAVHRVLASSPEPLTVPKIRAALPANLRPENPEELTEILRRQVAANVLQQYPKYRSQQDRYWDRPMPVHVAALIRSTLEEKPLAWSELRRKLPEYAQPLAEGVLTEQVTQGLLHRHPPLNARSGVRYGVNPPDPKEHLRGELSSLFLRLERLGFSQAQLRAGALELLHEEEWAPTPAAERSRRESSVAPAPTPNEAGAPIPPAARPETSRESEQAAESRPTFGGPV
jgi:hypothetical protein